MATSDLPEEGLKRYLDVREVADRYSVSVGTVWKWCKDGVLPGLVKLAPRTTRWNSLVLDAHDRKLEAQAANLTNYLRAKSLLAAQKKKKLARLAKGATNV